MSHCPRYARRAFTLVEMLVVIGIIGLLIAILLPAISSARWQAKITQCAANLRSISQACNTYALANDGRFPTLDMAGTGGNLWDVPHTFYKALRKQGMPHEAVFCPANIDRDTSEASFVAYGHFSIISYNLWIPRKN